VDRRPQWNARLGWLLALAALLAAIAAGVPDRPVTQWACAIERGRLEADSQELATLGDDLARPEEVARAFRLVAKVARPGVVHIRVRDPVEEADDPAWRELRRQLEERLGERFNENQWREFLRQQGGNAASGSGIIFDREGHILTNNHVVEGRSEIVVTLPDEREYPAVLVGSDRNTDLALVKIEASDLHPLRFGDSDRVEVGDWVIAVGAPFELAHTVTHGIISATGRSDVGDLARRGILHQNFLQTDAAINPGNSGGPLLNLRGEVIGVNTAIATGGNGYNAGIAFAIPSNLAVRIANELKTSGQIARGWLGITMGELTPADRGVLGLEGRGGVLIAGVIVGGPAEQAGLRVEDVVLSVNGRSVSNMGELRSAIADVRPGDRATLSLLRDGQQSDLTVTLGRRPPEDRISDTSETSHAGRELPRLGVFGRTLLPSFAWRAGFGERDRGVLVVEAADDGTTAITPGELIVACDGKPVATLANLEQILGRAQKGRPLELEVVTRSGERRTVRIDQP